MLALASLTLPSCPLSYPAGSTSWEPYRFRVVGVQSADWVGHLLTCFPVVAEFFGSQSLVLSAYPATLGLSGFSPSVDSYLHPPTFFSALQLAAMENRNLLLAAQPLIGADLLYRATREGFPLPKRILWGIGGYYTPVSLEKFIRSPEAFFPEKGGSTREAKKVCGSCDVRSECLDYALENDERFGIWGGLSERERRKLKRRAV